MSSLTQVTEILVEVLNLHDNQITIDEHSRLLGAIPEFDSMAVVSVLTALEEHYGFIIDDDEVDADIFETVGTLTSFVNSKV